MFSEPLKHEDYILCLWWLFRSSLQSIFVFWILSVPCFRLFTFINECDAEGEFGREGSRGFCFVLVSSLKCVSFTISAQKNFGTGHTKQYGVRVQVEEASMNVWDALRLSKLYSNLLSNAPPWASLVITFCTKWNEECFNSSFDVSYPVRIAENVSSGALISGLSISNAYMCIASPWNVLKILAQGSGWLRCSERDGGVSSAGFSQDRDPSLSDNKEASRTTAGFSISCR